MKWKAKKFFLNRKIDETGMSGTGIVAEGVLLPNKIAVMWWLVPPFTVSIYSSIQELEKLHSHGKGTTEVLFKRRGIKPSHISFDEVEDVELKGG